MNLDYDLRSNLLLSVSTVYDKEVQDKRSFDFGTLLRGAPAGTDYLARDTLGREIIQGGGTNIRGSGNGAGTFLYASSASTDQLVAGRYIASATGTYFPADWVTFDGTFAYDKRSRYEESAAQKDFRTQAVNTGTNFGNMTINDRNTEAMNGSYGLCSARTSRMTSRGASRSAASSIKRGTAGSGRGEQFVVKDVFTLSNTSQNQTITSA